MHDTNELLIVIIGILVTAAIGGGGYFFKIIIEKLDTLGRDVADIKPKVTALWDHFVKHNLP